MLPCIRFHPDVPDALLECPPVVGIPRFRRKGREKWEGEEKKKREVGRFF
jgi:hypothetical protein